MPSVRKISPENETNETLREIITLITILVLEIANICRAHQRLTACFLPSMESHLITSLQVTEALRVEDTCPNATWQSKNSKLDHWTSW